jgi:FkbH-like protein
MEYLRLKKHLKKSFVGFKNIKLGLLGDTATQFLAVALRGYGYEAKCDLEIFEADYNQIEQQVFNEASELYSYTPDIVVIFQSTQKMLRLFYELESPAEKLQFASTQLQKLEDLTEAINTNASGCKIICLNFPEIDDSVFGNYSNKTPTSFTYQLRKINYELMNLSQKVTNLFICDFSQIQNEYGRQTTFDPRLYIDADMVLSLDSLPVLAKSVFDITQSLSGVFKKCLILDLDNTLWGGIIGDDGIENIEIGHLGQGKAFSELQQWVKQLKERGILLAVCSKNDEAIAKEPFLKHPDMELSLDDISIFVANWDSKVDNIQYIQKFLNIGFDSMVFLDDNAFERNLISTHLPEIFVPELPVDPAEYLAYLRTLNLFETSSFTEGDQERTQQFQDEAERVIIQKTFTSEDDFLESLVMECVVKSFNDFNIPRVAQLTQRSNQFNLRTMRYSEADLRRFVATDSYTTLSFSLKDKYGDHGLISLVILCWNEDSVFIDTWIMSCRVLRRGVEHLVLNAIVDAAKQKDILRVVGEYIPTPKNALVHDHYCNLGFKNIGQEKWQLDIEDHLAKPHFIDIKG